jgi:hypothetical protein
MIPGQAQQFFEGAAAAAGASYKIERSLRFNEEDSAYLSRTPTSQSNKTKWTWAGWFKRGKNSNYSQLFNASTAVNNYTQVYVESDGTFVLASNSASGGNRYIISSAVLKDPSAWYHLVAVFDTHDAVQADRFKLYVNGVRLTDFSSTSLPGQGMEGNINSTNQHSIGSVQPLGTTGKLDGYLAEVYFIDGQALTPDTFGETNDDGLWVAKETIITGINDGSTYISSATLNSGTRGGGSGDSAMFSGVIPSTYSGGGNFGGVSVSPSTTSSSLTINLSKSLSGKVTIYPYFASSAANCEIVFSNGNTVSLTGSRLNFTEYDLGTQPSFNSFTLNQSFITGGGSNFGIGGMAIDGELLIDGDTDNFGPNGFYLKFADNSSNAALGTDSSGNSNTWTVNNLEVDEIVYSGNAYTGGLNQYMPAGVSMATSPTQLADTSNRTHFFVVGQNNTLNITVVATATSMTTGSSVYDGWGSNNPTTTLDNGTVTPNSSGTDSSVPGKNLATNTFTGLTIGQTYTISTKNGGAGNPHRVHYVTGATVQNQPIVASDSVIDSPTNYDADSGNNGGNYCTGNPLQPNMNASPVTLSNGNLKGDITNGTNWYTAQCTISVETGKWYFEQFIHSGYAMPGIAAVTSEFLAASDSVGSDPLGVGYFSNGNKYTGGSPSSYGASFTDGDLIGVAFDMDERTVTFYKNNVSQGVISGAITAGIAYAPVYSLNGQSGAAGSYTWNFGQTPFAYTPPTGYKALCTQNLSEPTVADGRDNFDTVLYTGNGGTQTVSGLNFEGDFFWLKSRSATYDHWLFDSVRGLTNAMYSNSNSPNSDYSPNGISATSSTGFTLNGSQQFNTNSATYAGWVWDAGSSNTTVNAGDENSNTYNSGEVWSSTGTITCDLNGSAVSNFSSNPLTNVFEGSLASSSMCSEGTAFSSGTKTYTYTFGTAQTNITSARIYLYQGNVAEGGAAGFGNGTVNKTIDGTYSWLDVTSTIPANGTVTAMTLTTTATSGVNSARNGFIAIELNGKMLLDNGVTPVDNFPSVVTTVRANTTAGFSIVSYTATGSDLYAAHGLGATPALIISKDRSLAKDWLVMYDNDNVSSFLKLNETQAKASASNVFISASSTTFGTGNDSGINTNGSLRIAYCFTPVEGYSAFGQYEGNNDADGPFLHTGFRPAFMLVKNIDASQPWNIFDATRSPHNTISKGLQPNNTIAEYDTTDRVDFLSNGIKIKASGGTVPNLNANTYFYAAFAENPFQTNGGLAR